MSSASASAGSLPLKQRLQFRLSLSAAIPEYVKVRQDIRERLPLGISRFLGYRPSGAQPPFEPFPPFFWLKKIPLKWETWIFGWIGAFGGILLIEAIMMTSTAFRDVYHAPVIITSFGASAVLLFGVFEAPLAQPRNFVLGHFVSALAGTCITRLFVLNASYRGHLDNTTFHPATFINGGLSMATSLLAQQLTGNVHPPAGATGLNAAVQAQVVMLSWRYLPVMLASSLIMLGWALVINNLGRRRYPAYWWSPGGPGPFVRKQVPRDDNKADANEITRDDEQEEKNLRDLEKGELSKSKEEGGTP